MARIGVQAMMLRWSFEQHGTFETLRSVREIGYRALEVSQVPMTPENVSDLVRARDELGIDIASLSATYDAPTAGNDALLTDFDKIVADARTVGATKVRMGMVPLGVFDELDTTRRFCRGLEEVAKRLADEGIDFYYHNHLSEFLRYDGRYVIDILADSSPHVGMELDVHWLQRAGQDPQGTIERFAGRVKLIHLKDYRIGRTPEAAFVARDSGDRATYLREVFNTIEFAEVGEGNLDFGGIIPASVAAGAEYLFVEQDDLYGRDVLDCLQTSHDNLVALGHGDLF
ncbi:sugar phosphate isomerase [Litorihabitans aurantiacus]|uniref:Sugar phosphate isomerase n=2 Tax=Litorihabitans aurantiacus TaxID=1930061 RepID=A0AA37XFP7_9MICO|nr:sugar phosphate isomerase [Litorihabitans aurantiacus]